MTQVNGVKLPYEVGPIRPPSEFGSLMVRVTRNCSWNRCEFCMLYKGQTYEARPVEDVLRDISASQEGVQPGRVVYTTAFLQDADAVSIPTQDLMTILQHLKKTHPSIQRITTYARAVSLYRKSLEELKELHSAGLERIHRGLETGYDALLKYMMKGATQRIQIEGGQKVRQAGISLSDYVIPGLGGNLELDGQPTWKRHAEETAHVCNDVNPDFIRLRSFNYHRKSPLWEKVEKGEFKRLLDQDIVREIRYFIEKLDRFSNRVESDHILNVLNEVSGKIPEDRDKMFKAIDTYLGLSVMQQYEFRLFTLQNMPALLESFLYNRTPGDILASLTEPGGFLTGLFHPPEGTTKTIIDVTSKNLDLSPMERYEFAIGVIQGKFKTLEEFRIRYKPGKILEDLVRGLMFDII